MEDLIEKHFAEMKRLGKELRSLGDKKVAYRKRQRASFQDRQSKYIQEAQDIQAKMNAGEQETEEKVNSLRTELEVQIGLMWSELERTQATLSERLRELQDSIDRDETETNERIEENDVLIEKKRRKVGEQLDQLNEKTKRLGEEDSTEPSDSPLASGAENIDMPDGSLTPTAAGLDVPTASYAGHKRMASSSQPINEVDGSRKRSRHRSPLAIPEAQVREVADTPSEPQQKTPVSPQKEPPLVTPDSAQGSVQKPKGLIVAPWQKDRLANYDDVRGKEYIYVRHNVPRVLRCPDCPGFAAWPTCPIKDVDKAHFANSELHRAQRARDKDTRPGRGRNSGDGITGDWITRNFGWRVVNGVPTKGSLEEWAAAHNEEVDRLRNGKVVSDIVLTPTEYEKSALDDWPVIKSPTGVGRARARSGRSRSSLSGMEPITPVTTGQSESETPDRGFAGSPESISRAAAREGGYSMRSIARRNYTIPGLDDIRDKA